MQEDLPEILREQPDTPRTRLVKRMVINANRGYQNPLNLYKEDLNVMASKKHAN